jgi:hypothetical protein
MATRASGYVRNAHDFYQEDRRTVECLLEVEQFSGSVWDPSCGEGNIPQTLIEHGYQTVGTDLVDRGYGPMLRCMDFLLYNGDPLAPNAVLNPPYDKSLQFALHALKIIPGKIAILEKTTWLEGVKRHKMLWSRGHLVRMWQFRDRIRVPPGGVEMPGNHPSTAYCWYVFDRSHTGPFTGGWISHGDRKSDGEQPPRVRRRRTGEIPQSANDGADSALPGLA